MTNIVFIKTHKTASSIIREEIERYGKSNNLNIFDPDDKQFESLLGGNQSNFTHLIKHYFKGSEDKYQISARHLSMDKEFFDKFIPNALYITSLREPLKRAISHYYYGGLDKKYKVNFNEWYIKHGGIEIRDYDLNKFQESYKNTILNNYMSLYCGFKKEEDITEGNIIKLYDLIMFQDNMNQSFKKLSELLNFKFINKVTNKNSYSVKPTEEVINKFKENNKLDYKFYNLSKKIYGYEGF
jgi:hypothetical protein